MTFTSPILLFLAVLIAIALFVVGWMRRPALPRASLLLAMCGIIFLTLATGGVSCRRGREPRVAGMGGCSPSTRGAGFRDAEWVRARVRRWVNKQRNSATPPTGSPFLTTRLGTTTETITARLSRVDAWRENDALAIRPSPPMASQRWWVGDSPPRGWIGMSPANLPLE